MLQVWDFSFVVSVCLFICLLWGFLFGLLLFCLCWFVHLFCFVFQCGTAFTEIPTNVQVWETFKWNKPPSPTPPLVSRSAGEFTLISLLARTWICCFPRTLNEHKHNPCNLGQGLYTRVKPPCLTVVPAKTWTFSQPFPWCAWLGRTALTLTAKGDCSCNLWFLHLNLYCYSFISCLLFLTIGPLATLQPFHLLLFTLSLSLAYHLHLPALLYHLFLLLSLSVLIAVCCQVIPYQQDRRNSTAAFLLQMQTNNFFT